MAKAGFYDRGSGTFTNYGLSVLLGKGDGTFHAAINYETGAPPRAVATADFDGDGKPDLAVANSGARAGSVSVLPGNGDGTFESSASYEVAMYPQVIVAGDFNGDAQPDLAIAGYGGISVLLGKGDGAFQAAVSYPAGSHISSMSGGDFNDDGKPDLAAADYYSRSVSVLLGQGDGTFRTPAISYSEGAHSVVAGDFNIDGKVDLTVANGRNLSMLLGRGDGTWQALGYQPFGRQLERMVVGDFNTDAKPDLAVVGYSINIILILLGKGDGTFEAGDQYPVGWERRSVVVSDFNADRKLDLATPGGILLGNGDGTFQGPVAAPTSGRHLAVGDFNRDGKADLAVAKGSVSVALGKGDGTFESPVTYQAGVGAVSVAVGDFNSDGKVDLVAANFMIADWSVFSDLSVLIGNGDGTFQNAVNYDMRFGWDPEILVDDFNGDRKLDLAIPDSVVLGNGDGTFQGPVDVGRGAVSLAGGDFNGDGKPDLAMAAGDYGLSVLLNTCASAGIRLAVTRSNATALLSWPLPYTNFVLKSVSRLDSTNWQRFSGVVKTNNGRCEATMPLSERQRYFRLRKS